MAVVAAEPGGGERFGAAAQILHWAMAALILAMLALGAMLVGCLGDYSTALRWHKGVGLIVLVLALLRIGNRVRRSPPPAPASLGGPERIVAALSEAAMYALFLAQPVVGWALVSASGAPLLAFGLHIPAIAPVSIQLYGVLRVAHSILAYALLACVVAHVGAVLFHTIGLRDGLLRRMLPARSGPRPD